MGRFGEILKVMASAFGVEAISEQGVPVDTETALWAIGLGAAYAVLTWALPVVKMLKDQMAPPTQA